MHNLILRTFEGWGFALMTALFSVGCVEDLAQPEFCSESDPGPTPIRRLTRVEYNNTVYQLLGDSSRPAEGVDRNVSLVWRGVALIKRIGGWLSHDVTLEIGAKAGQTRSCEARTRCQGSERKMMRRCATSD